MNTQADGRPSGRRERNKQDKQRRILAAATSLLAERSIDDVTTQEIAEAADIGTGTLFLYARTKGELLLMVQNSLYADALERGTAAAADAATVVEAVMAVVSPVVACNRRQPVNGATYLREMVFGDPSEPRHAEALQIVARTEAAVADVLRDRAGAETAAHADTLAGLVSAAMFMAMAPAPEGTPTSAILDEVERAVRVLVR